MMFIMMFKIGLVLVLVLGSYCEQALIDLQQEIGNTQQLIVLYQRKLELLRSIYKERYPNHPYNHTIRQVTVLSPQRESAHVMLIHKYNYSCILFDSPLVIHHNKLMDLESKQTIAQFIGEALIVQHNSITTLISGKISMLQIREEQGRVKTQEEYIGLNADNLSSIWHRNYNIKDGEDLLIQWFKNKIYLRGKETHIITLEPQEEVLALYSLNQYKVIFASTFRIGTINSRSMQILQFQSAFNITKMGSSSPVTIRKVVKHDNSFIVLLSSSEVAKYFYPKIVSVQLLPSLSTFNLSTHSLHQQYLHPYLFLADGQVGAVKVFQGRMGRLQHIIDISLQGPFEGIAFFKQNDSYRMFLNQQEQTLIYELLLPKVEEVPVSSNYFKLVGVATIICLFIYYKWFRPQANTPSIESKDIQKKRPPPKENDKQKARFTQNEVQQFLKRQQRENTSSKKTS